MTLLLFLYSFLFLKLPENNIKPEYLANISKDSSSVFFIRKIEISGNFKTADKVILRELALHEGDTLQKKQLNKFLERERQKIVNLNLFITVKVSLKNQTDDEADLLVEVKERWYYIALPTFSLADRNFNDWWYNHNHDFNRTIYGVYLAHTNLTGSNDKLRLVAETGFIPNFSLSYSTPYLDKSQKLSASVGGGYALSRTLAYRNYQDQSQFIETEKKQREFWNIFGVISKRQGFYKSHSLELSYNHAQIADTIALVNPNYLLDGRTLQRYFLASYAYNFDNRDSKQYALKGHRFSIQATKYGLFPTDDINQFVLTSSYTQFFPISRKFYANFSVRGKVSLPQKQPYLQTVGLGYRADYVRGYELYVIDGQSYGLLKTNLKFQLLDKVFDLHKFLKIRQFNTFPFAAYLNTFLDFGVANNAYAETVNSHLANTLLIGGGVGVDVVSWYNYVGRFNYAVNRMGEGRIYFSTMKEF